MGVRSVAQIVRVAGSTHSPPGAVSPEDRTGEAGSGLPGAGRPSVSILRIFPASGPAPAPVATSSDPSGSTASAPPGPRGIPVSTGFGGSPGASRSTCTSEAVPARA